VPPISIYEESVKMKPYFQKQQHELLCQALETDRGSKWIYETALPCAQNEDLKDEWEEDLEQTGTYEQVLLKVLEELGLTMVTVELVEQEEDHHLYHTKGVVRELWIDSCSLPTVLPLPEKGKMGETAIGDARAENLRDDLLKAKH
jgi:hypothetical protein